MLHHRCSHWYQGYGSLSLRSCLPYPLSLNSTNVRKSSHARFCPRLVVLGWHTACARTWTTPIVTVSIYAACHNLPVDTVIRSSGYDRSFATIHACHNVVRATHISLLHSTLLVNRRGVHARNQSFGSSRASVWVEPCNKAQSQTRQQKQTLSRPPSE